MTSVSELQDLISDVVKKEIGNMNLTNAVPCRVINLLGNGSVQVELISTKARYIVANYSGSALKVGEITQLFYRGVISNHTAYIGASNYKPERTKFIIMESKTGLIGSELSVISNAYVKSPTAKNHDGFCANSTKEKRRGERRDRTAKKEVTNLDAFTKIFEKIDK